MTRCFASLISLCLASSVAILGCAEEEDPLKIADLDERIERGLGDVLRYADSAAGGIRDALPPAEALALFESVLGVDTPLAQAVHSIGWGLWGDLFPIDPSREVSNLKGSFTEWSYLGDGIYRVSPETFCSMFYPSQGIKETCAALFDMADLRFRTMVSPAMDGSAASEGALVLALQVGPHHDEPLVITLEPHVLSPSVTRTSLTVALDLDILQRALDELVDLPGSSIPKTALTGHVTGRLEADPLGASAQLTIDRPLWIRVAGASADLEGVDGFSLASTASKVLDIVLSPGDPGGTVSLGLSNTTIELPARADGKRFAISLGGLTADAVLTIHTPLQINNIGIRGRAATVRVNGMSAQTLEINPRTGRTFDVRVQHDGYRTKLQVTPTLELQMTVDHKVLGDPPPVYDVTSLSLDGSVRSGASWFELFEVTAGSFRIGTTPAEYGVSARSGQCVLSTETTDSMGRPFLQWTAKTCY